ncbi:hypothetical protein ACFFMM_26145 [Micromonospora chaiyaphumensis]|uniref:Uncharacterized protein n=1 Tax=Micromonospora chaiyaphumensis TaxID=307119 RepID=A0A1C4UDB2_9ACTN|nr:hypothetical protein [Micromonospora chaiyaphumensis]SCE69642.1 hypothetical protein GA0070214_101577 [Micromonospora chaiyaphumensis]
MSSRRSDGPADRAESERLLDAARAGSPPQAAADPLAHLLAAAAAPGTAAELVGEERALAAFRAARVDPAPAVAPRPRHRFRVGAVLAGVAAAATAGVAFAAVSLDPGPEPAPPPAPTAPGHGTGGPSTGAGDPGTSGVTPSGATPGGVPSTAPTPGASGGSGKPASAGKLAGQCGAYLAKSDAQRAKALESPGFADLVAAAGGPERVEGYCLALVPEKSPEPKSEPKPTSSPKPKSSPKAKSEPKATPSSAARKGTTAVPAGSPPRSAKPGAATGR